MAAGNDLGRLLTQLRNVSSPLERMKLISRAWRSVKRLGPRERSVLARQVGIDGAEELIEGIAVRRGGLNPATVQRALDRLKEVQPGRLKQTLKDLQDPERRRELIDRGLDAATDVLAGPEEAQPPEPPLVIEIDDDEDEETPVRATPKPPGKEVPPPPRPRPARRETVASAAAAAAVAATAKRPSPASRAVEPAPPPRPVETAKKKEEPAPEKPPVVASPEPPPPPPIKEKPQPAAAGPPPPEAQAAPSELFRLVEGQTTLFRRLRALRDNLALGRGSSAERLQAVLDLFSAGWARRRVVSAMIEARVPDSVEEAVFLIEQLETRADRRWCARTLLHEWELSSGERELIASRHGASRPVAQGA